METMGTGAAGAEEPVAGMTAPEPAAENAAQEAVVNPFDFSAADAGDDDGGGGEPAAEDDGGDYELDFGQSFGGSDEVRDMITGHARAAGISREAGSRFVASVCESLLQQHQAQTKSAYDALAEEWGADFDKNEAGCKRMLGQMLKAGVIQESDKAALLNPSVFRVINHIRQAMGERPALGTTKAVQMDGRKEYERIMSDPKSPQFQILMNPQHPEYRQTAAYMNGLAGMKLH